MNKKRIISIILSWALLLMTSLPTPLAVNAAWDGASAESYAGGSGTSADPYLISNASELAYARDMVNAGTHRTAYFKLTQDIDLENQEWTPMGISTNTFGGTFDGNGHVVKNIKITTAATEGTGFFSVVNGGTIKNLGIDNLDMDVDSGNVGGMVGKAIGTFTNCYVANSSVRNTFTQTGTYPGIGGFIGYLWAKITVTNCYVYNTEIAGPPRAKMSGFCGTDGGTSDASVFTNCYVADVTVVPETDAKTPQLYGFAQKNSTTDITSAVNCFSTLTSGGGTFNETNAGFLYNSEKELGTASATKDDIVAALVTNLADTVFAVDESVNDGYPYIDYNVVIPTPTATPTPTPTATPTPTPTPTATPTATPTVAPTAAATATPVVTAPPATPTATPSSTVAPLPTPNPTGWDGTTSTAYAGGSGTSASPYLISNAAELAYARDNINAGTHKDKYFKLNANIDLNNREWTPIGNTTNTFTGNFNGAGYAVKNVLITTPANGNNTGFFCHVAGTIKNLGLDGVTIQVEQSGGVIGGMIGRGYGTFENCYVKNALIQNTIATQVYDQIGGFIGRIRSTSTIKNCYVYNAILTGSCRSVTGGFFGNDEGTSDTTVMTNCYVADVERVGFDGGRTSAFYGFGKKRTAEDTTSAVNSFSTGTGENGTYPEGNAGYLYQSTMSLGTEGASKADIVAALVTSLAGTVYKTDDSINGGYPYIDYAVAAPVPTPTPTPTTAPTVPPSPGATTAPTTAPTATPTPVAGVPTPNPSGWDGTEATDYAGGNGSAESPYLIATAGQLAYARKMINAGTHKSKTFELAADIDWNHQEWTPIGLNDTYNFSGTFNGAGHKIKNINITQNFSYTAVFGHVNGAKINDLGVDNMNIYNTSGSGNFGGMIARGGVTVKNCYIKNSTINLTTTSYITVGMFVSTVRTASTYENCYVYNSKVKAQSGSTIGGFAGGIENPQTSIFKKCYVSGVEILEGNKATVYPFGRNIQDKTQTVTECFSDLASADGTRYEFNESQAFGTAGATKAQITQALVTSDQIMWATDATINNGYPYLTFKYPMEPDEEAVFNDAEALELTVTQPVKAAFTLPTTGENGSTITWSSDNPAIVVSGGSASVICQDDEVQVTLTATLTKGNYKKAKVFTVTVAEIIVSYVVAGDVTTTDNGNGTTTLTMPIECTGLQYASYDNLSFWATLVDEDGEIIDQDVMTKPKKTGDNQTDTFSVTLQTKGAGQEYKYYLWGDGNISLIDNTPTAIENLTPIEKVKNVTLNWDACYDDSGDPVIYKVYRDDNVYLGETYATSFKADGVSSSQTHTYKVVPTDKRAQLGASATTDSCQMINMYYINASGGKNGISTSFTAGPDNDSYADTKEITINGSAVKVFTSNGFKSDNVTQRGHMIYFTVDSSLIKQSDSELVFELVYYDKGAHKIQFIYNGKRPLGADGKPVADTSALARFKGLEKTTGGTNALITDVIRVGDAELRKSNQSSGADFGIVVPGGVNWGDVAIKEIRVIQASLYD